MQSPYMYSTDENRILYFKRLHGQGNFCNCSLPGTAEKICTCGIIFHGAFSAFGHPIAVLEDLKR